MVAEFDGIRSKLYKEALEDYPNARLQDIEVMNELLKPKKGETILEIGAGSGFFSKYLSEILGNEGRLIVSDPSSAQLAAINDLEKGNIRVLKRGAEEIVLEKNSVDAIWSFGAMHHCFRKEEAMGKFSKVLKNGGRIVICDVFTGSKLAKHFNEKVDRYCITGHKVEFWTDKMIQTLFEEFYSDTPHSLEIKPLNIRWLFDTKEEIGDFLYKIHGMTGTTPEVCLKGAEEILGIEKVRGKYELNWPMKAIVIK
jgi:arsenite methyltransferase